MIALFLACGWVIVATTIALMPRRAHPFFARLLLIPIPALVWLVWAEQGALFGLAFLAGSLSIMRYPVRYFYRRIRDAILGSAP
jgi:hypothetical protein